MEDRPVMGGRNGIVLEARFHGQLLQDLYDALDAWQLAIHHFNQAIEPEAIDDAIYLMMAAEKRYEGLLRIAKRSQLTVRLDGAVNEAAAGHMLGG